MTANAWRERYTEGAIFGGIESVLYPIHVGIFNLVGLAIIPLVGVDLPNGVFGMATGGDAMGKLDAVIHRCRSQIREEDKPVIGVHRGMLL